MFPQGRCTRGSGGGGGGGGWSPWAAAMGYNPHNFAAAAATAFGAPAATAPQPPARNGAPPASSSFIARLKPINVSSDDLLEASNKECVVCLGDQKVGDQATKLPCGHLFHGACLEEWLRIHGTCPTCRYELETDDKTYETERKSRMKDRRLRYRKDELHKKSISELKDIMRTLDVSFSGCLDKTDLVDRIERSGKIEIMEGLPPVEYTLDALRSTPVSELRAMLRSFYIEEADVLEKGELVRRVVESGRVVILETASEDTSSESQILDETTSIAYSFTTRTEEIICDESVGILKTDNEDISPPAVKSQPVEASSTVEATASSSEATATASAYSLSSAGEEAEAAGGEESGPRFHLMKMSVKELKSIASAFNVDVKQCIYKEDIVDRIIAAQIM